jgi:DNA invertase Pin-like site-specific DNA recombinase
MSNLKGQLVGYIRVSTLEQNTARQEDQLKEFRFDEVFTDYASGKDTVRPQLQAALKHLRKNDTLIVYSMDRLARNLDDLRKIVKELTVRGIAVKFIKESLTFTGEDSPMSNLLLSVMGAFAEFERSLIRERIKEGIAVAKTKGVYKGRKRSLDVVKITELIDRDKANNHKNRSALAKDFGISRETLYQYLRAGMPIAAGK